MHYVKMITTVLGGLALFLYGITILSKALQMAAGDRLKILLEKVTTNKFMALLTGVMVTMIIQSSSATTVTLVALINAKLITLAQSIPVIMGANIGTTVTAQLIAFKLTTWAPLLIAIGFGIYAFSKSEKWKYIGQVFIGFGILFLGMKLMSSEMKVLAKQPNIKLFLSGLAKSPLLAVLISMIFTEIVQSSSATTGLVIAMGASGLINLPTAVAFIFGANIGTTITVCIAAFGPTGSTITAKRAAISHVLFNVSGALLFIPFIGPFSKLIAHTSGDIARQIANCHTIFNISVTLIFLPLSGVLAKIVTFFIKGEEVEIETGIKYLDENGLKTPVIAIGLAEMETLRMARIALSMLQSSKKSILEKNSKVHSLVLEQEKLLDDLDVKIREYISKIDDQYLLNQQKIQMAILNHFITDIERIGDYSNHICEKSKVIIDNEIELDPETIKELTLISNQVEEAVKKSIVLVERYDEKLIKDIQWSEKEIDSLVIEFEEKQACRHKARLKVSPKAIQVDTDIMRDLERISDHAQNIAYVRKVGF